MSYHYYYSADRFDGFFSAIFRRYGAENYQKVFTLKGTETLNDPLYSDPIQLFNPNPQRKIIWHTKSTQNASLSISLRHERFITTAVSLRSRADDDCYFPIELTIEGSNNDEDWKLLHHYEGSELNGRGKETTLNITNEQRRPYSNFKITQIKNEDLNDFYFVLNRVEFFGYNTKACVTQKRAFHVKTIETLLIILLS